MTLNRDDLEKLFLDENEIRESTDNREILKIKKSVNLDELKKIRKKIKKSEKRIKQERRVNFNPFLKFTIFAGIISCILLIGLNISAISDQLKWIYNVEYLDRKIPEKKQEEVRAVEKINLPSNIPAIAPKEESRGLKIAKIGIDAPVLWETEQDKIIDSLVNGVVHYKGTSLPGEGGNIFLVGHSSNYFWINSDYNSIFSLLDKLERGDRILISKDNRNFYYDVVDKKIVNPDQVDVLKDTPKETLSLMTCWPIGTSVNRLLIISQLKYSN